MSTSTLILSGFIILVTHLVGAITGVGSTMLALPLLVWLIGDLQTAVAVLLIVGTFQSYQMMLGNIKHIDWREVRSIVFWAGLGLPIGIMAMHHLPKRALLLTFGTILILGGLSRLIPDPRIAKKSPVRPILNLLLFIGGIIHGAFVCGGATVAIYAQYTLAKKDTFRSTLFMIWSILNTFLIAGTLMHGAVTMPVKKLALFGLPFLLAGNWLGGHVNSRIKQRQFNQVVAILVIVAGGITIFRVL